MADFLDLTAVVLSRQEMEARRLEAVKLFEVGATGAYVARQFNVSTATGSRWQRKWKNFGLLGMKRRRASGRPPRLSPTQLSILQAEVARPCSHRQLAVYILQRFGIHYDDDHVGRIQVRLGIPCLHPKRRSRWSIPVPALGLPREVANG